MTWVLLAPSGEILASGSWQSVVEAGEEEGALVRRYSECDGREACPQMGRRGFVIAPAGMFPELSNYGLAD